MKTKLLLVSGLAQLAVLAATLNAAGTAPRPEGYTREVETVLGEMIAAYANADSYRDNGRVTVLQQTGRVRQITKMPSTTALRRGGEIHVLGGMQSITCDGQQLQIVLDTLGQFQRLPAPSELTMGHLRMGAPGAGLDEGYPEVLEFLLGDKVLERWTSQMRKVAIVNQDKMAKVADRNCLTLAYETVHGAEINLFIDVQTHLLVRCDIDNTRAQQSPNAPASTSEPPTVQVVLQFDPAEVGSKLSDATFALADPAAQGMRLVEVFEAKAPGESAPQPAPSPSQLVGKPAPSIPDQNFAGKPALLFFWSPDAGPGNLAAIQMVERLRVGAGESGVAFLSLVAAGADPVVVDDLLAAKKAGYPNAMDTTGDVARRYHIDALPAWVLIGADGKVQHTASGDPNAAEQELALKLRASASTKSATPQ